MSRKDIRHEFADLLTASLNGLVSNKPGLSVPAVYRGQVADFKKTRSQVVVSSGGSEVGQLARKNLIESPDLSVDTFVIYADPDASWTEENAEDLLDDIVERIIRTIEANPTGRNWKAIDWIGKSQNNPVEVGGTEYRHEQITLHFS